jgi:hypothetical protein
MWLLWKIKIKLTEYLGKPFEGPVRFSGKKNTGFVFRKFSVPISTGTPDVLIYFFT